MPLLCIKAGAITVIHTGPFCPDNFSLLSYIRYFPTHVWNIIDEKTPWIILLCNRRWEEVIKWSFVPWNEVLKYFNWLLNMSLAFLTHARFFLQTPRKWDVPLCVWICCRRHSPWSDNKTSTCEKKKLSMEGEKHSCAALTIMIWHLCIVWLRHWYAV